MLSYDKLLDSLVSAANADSIQTSTIRKTCAGPSDLENVLKRLYKLLRWAYLEECADLTSVHDFLVSMWPPPRAIKR